MHTQVATCIQRKAFNNDWLYRCAKQGEIDAFPYRIDSSTPGKIQNVPVSQWQKYNPPKYSCEGGKPLYLVNIPLGISPCYEQISSTPQEWGASDFKRVSQVVQRFETTCYGDNSSKAKFFAKRHIGICIGVNAIHSLDRELNVFLKMDL